MPGGTVDGALNMDDAGKESTGTAWLAAAAGLTGRGGGVLNGTSGLWLTIRPSGVVRGCVWEVEVAVEA